MIMKITGISKKQRKLIIYDEDGNYFGGVSMKKSHISREKFTNVGFRKDFGKSKKEI
jgi:hypothetical protein